MLSVYRGNSRCDEELASYGRIEERELEAGGGTSPSEVRGQHASSPPTLRPLPSRCP